MNLTTFLAPLSEWLGVIATLMILSLSPAFRFQPVGFRYPRREAWVSLGVFSISLILVIVLTSSGQITANASTLPRAVLMELAAAAAALLLFTLALLIRRQPLRSIGWSPERLKVGIQLGLALALLAIFLRGKIYSILNGITAAEGFTLLTLLVICVAEETVFRGYLQLRFNAWLGEPYGWLASALLFTLWHIPLSMAAGVPLLSAVLLRAAQGLVLGWVSRKSGHVLATGLYRTFSEWIPYML